MASSKRTESAAPPPFLVFAASASTRAGRSYPGACLDDRAYGGLRHIPAACRVAEAERRLAELGPVEDDSSRSVRSIVLANVFTLFNAIIGVFFILILSLGLFADALFGLIAAINSYIGIRQELKAKETLDELALLVAPTAKAIRDGRVVELRADEVVPGDMVRVEPGDQLVADGEVIASRGLTLDESLLTGESDGIRKQTGDRLLSGSFCHLGLGLLRARRRPRGLLRREGRRRGARVPPPALAAAGGGQPDPAGRRRS